MSRPYGDPLGSDPSNNDYPGPRPMSPLHPYPNRSINGFPYRGGSIVPNGNTGPAAASLFSSPHHHNEPTPYNHHPTSQLFSGNINGGSHENKLPNSPSNPNIPLEGNRPNPGQHSYSNLQVNKWVAISCLVIHIIFESKIAIGCKIVFSSCRASPLLMDKQIDRLAFHLQV